MSERIPELAGRTARIVYEGELTLEVQVDAQGEVRVIDAIVYVRDGSAGQFLNEDLGYENDPFPNQPGLDDRLLELVSDVFPTDAEVRAG